MKKTLLKYLSIILVIVLIDQLLKGGLLYMITESVPMTGNAWDIVRFPYIIKQFGDFFNIVFTWNPGASFSMMRTLGESAPLVIIVATGIIIGMLGYYLVAWAQKFERLPLTLVIGGALGNLVDRIRFGAVIDFLDFHIKNIHYPAFNFADICICLGVGLYLLNWVIVYRRKKKEGK